MRLVSLRFSKGWHARVLRSQRIAQTLEGQEHAPTETSRTLSPGPDPWSFVKFQGRPFLPTAFTGFGAHGARPIHPAVTVGRPHWHSVCIDFVLGQCFRIVVIMRLTILATIAIAPRFVILQNMVCHQCTSTRSHTSAQASSHHPSPWARTCKCMFL